MSTPGCSQRDLVCLEDFRDGQDVIVNGVPNLFWYKESKVAQGAGSFRDRHHERCRQLRWCMHDVNARDAYEIAVDVVILCRYKKINRTLQVM